MDITGLKSYIDEHYEAYSEISFGIATIAGIITTVYYGICWWFFPPFVGILLIFLLFDVFLYKFSK